jgi:hypothetical protein
MDNEECVRVSPSGEAPEESQSIGNRFGGAGLDQGRRNGMNFIVFDSSAA